MASLLVAEDLRKVFDADFQQYKSEARGCPRRMRAGSVYIQQARPSTSWRPGLSQ